MSTALLMCLFRLTVVQTTASIIQNTLHLKQQIARINGSFYFWMLSCDVVWPFMLWLGLDTKRLRKHRVSWRCPNFLLKISVFCHHKKDWNMSCVISHLQKLKAQFQIAVTGLAVVSAVSPSPFHLSPDMKVRS